MCASPKTGTTNFQYAALAIQRNMTISKLRPSLRGTGAKVYELVRRYSRILSENSDEEKLAKELFYSDRQFRFIHVNRGEKFMLMAVDKCV